MAAPIRPEPAGLITQAFQNAKGIQAPCGAINAIESNISGIATAKALRKVIAALRPLCAREPDPSTAPMPQS